MYLSNKLNLNDEVKIVQVHVCISPDHLLDFLYICTNDRIHLQKQIIQDNIVISELGFGEVEK